MSTVTPRAATPASRMVGFRMVRSLEGAGRPPASAGLRRTRLHLVPDGLLRRRDDFRGPVPGLDLLLGRLREVMRLDGQLLRQVARTEDADAIGRAVGQALLPQRFLRDLIAVIEDAAEIADVDDMVHARPGGVAETALGHAAE